MNIDEFKEATQRYACLVNRTVVIDTLEKKANITNYEYSLPKHIKTDLIEKRNQKGKFLYYKRTTPVNIKDVDGKIKKTVKTSYYRQDKITEHKKAEIGIYDGKLGGKYHGRKSCNWKQEYLTLQEIIDALNSGYAIAPGEFQPPEGESRRSGEYCMSRQFILFDADEWTSEHYGLKNIDELIERYPDITKDFYWIGESISSRSSLKPELRCRLMLVLPQPIKKGEDILWETAIDNIVDKYPFIARGVGVDKVRLSFGNARLDCDNRILNGFISQESFDTWKQKASEKAYQAEKEKQELAEQKQHQAEKRQRDNAIRTELKKRGYPITDQMTDPIAEFCEVDPATLLTNYGIATHLQGNEWNYIGSGAGRSLVLENGIIKPFSNSAQEASPADEPTSPVNAHRYILNCLFQLDMTKQNEKQQLKCELATMGYGTHPDEWKKKKREEMVYAVREGLESPLSLRSAAPPLPTEQEWTKQPLSTLQDNAKEIKKAFTEKKRIVAVKAGTGEGKTEKAIAYTIDGGKLFMTLNSIPLAEQVHQRFSKTKTNAFLWRSRSKGYTDNIKNAPHKERIKLFQDGEILCIKPEMIDAVESKGLQPQTAICSQCEVKNECTEYGYLSQKTKAQKTQVLCVAMPKAFTDPASKQFYTDLTINKSDKLINVIDEAKVHDLFITCELSKQQLQEWQVSWKGERLAEFAKQVLTEIEIENDPYAVAEIVSKLTDAEIEKLSYQACRYNIAYKKIDKSATCEDTNKPLANYSLLFDNDITAYVALDTDSYDMLLNQKLPAVPPIEIKEKGFIVLTPEQCFKLGIFKTDTIQDINALPSTYRSPDWTPFQQLKIFAERYKRKCDAPIEYSNNTLTWIIPPRIHPKIKKLICMSATLNEDLFNRTFDKDKTKFIKTVPTPHVEGAKAYQIRTGAYPRRSLLEYSKESDYKDVIGLSKIGKNFLNVIETEIKRDENKKHVIITFKKIVEFESERLTETHPNLLGIHSFHKMEGLDYTEPNITFWILGTPDVSKIVVEHRAKMFYGNDTEKLNYDKDPDTRKYTDPRVQLCWENEVTARLIQAVGRGRLNRLANTVILFSNVLIPDFTNKAIGFVIEDLEVAGNLDNLTKTAQARLASESDIRTADNPNAHQQTRETREKKRQKQRELKASRKNRALKMYSAGKTPKQISEKLDIHINTVRNWIKKIE